GADVFADIKLEEENLEVDAAPRAESADAAVEKASEDEPARSRGYGQHKHDEYADDIDTGDALAEADIYIDYGRFPQALDLLKTAIAAEPDNAAYKLKLMDVSAELGDQAEMMAQYAELKALGDADSLAAAESIVQGAGSSSLEPVQGDDLAESASSDMLELSEELDLPELDISDSDDTILPNLDLPDLDLTDSSADINLEDDFGSLEIEGFESDDDELDLSADFEGDTNEVSSAGADEEMVFAADSDAMSTKLDLARAYLDMGDQDGARQIFEEVVAEGSDEQKEEARALLERLD
ncbi:MAG: hypothetical protein IMF06_08980, partial [Proteobacteria bacterium]|nr:hypothetical protein [Pseudomonadota bacterium]